MTDRPINLVETELARVRAGAQSLILRPIGAPSRIRTGERLWVREPFFLEARFDDYAPTAAVRLGARVAAFAADLVEGAQLPGCGKRRRAREMPRACHRAHLDVLLAGMLRLHDISDAQIAAAGLGTRETHIGAWNTRVGNGLTISGARIRYCDNPRLVALRVEWVGRSI